MTPEYRAALLRLEACLHERQAGILRLAAAATLATATIGRFAKAMLDAEEATFMEMVVRYDEAQA